MTERLLPAGKLSGALLADLLRSNPVGDPRVLIGPGIGHDSAAIQFGDQALVIKTDPITFPTDRPAYHLIHINANDLACQGALPRWLLVTALFPAGNTTADGVRRLFADLVESARTIGVELIGGHTEITAGLNRPLLIGTMLGEVDTGKLVRPTDARPGDRLLMTQSAGIEGTAILANEGSGRGIDPAILSIAHDYLENPGISVVNAAMALSRAGAVSAMHDPTEGGIATAVREIAAAAGAGLIMARENVPVSPETAAIAAAFGIDPLGLLSSGSLLAAVPKDRVAIAEDALRVVDVPFAWIGKLTPVDKGIQLRESGTVGPLPEFAVDELARVLAEEIY